MERWIYPVRVQRDLTGVSDFVLSNEPQAIRWLGADLWDIHIGSLPRRKTKP